MKSNIRESQTASFVRARPLAFTLVELLIVLAITAVLISLLLPGIGMARDQASFIKCKATQRQMGTSLNLYTMDYKSRVPTGWLNLPGSPYTTINDRVGSFIYYGGNPLGLGLLHRVSTNRVNIDNYVSDPRLFYCPSSVPTGTNGYRFSYGWNTSGGPTRTNASYIQSGWYYRYTYGAANEGVAVPPLTVPYKQSRIEYLAGRTSTKPSYAAFWDIVGTRAAPTVFTGYNLGAHSTGYNIYYYNGSSLTLSVKRYNWPVFPLNTWYNDQTDPWATVNGVFRSFVTLVDLPLANGLSM